VNATTQAAALFVAGQTTAAGGVISGQAVALAKGALQTMLYTQIKTAAAVVAGVGILGSVGVIAYQATAEERGAAAVAPAPAGGDGAAAAGEKKPHKGKIEAGAPSYASKTHEAWKSKGRIVGIAKEAPEFKVTILDADKKEVATAKVEKTKDGRRVFEVWLAPGTYTAVISAGAYETLEVPNLEVKVQNDLKIDLTFTKKGD
jgi:hypothetical protein